MKGKKESSKGTFTPEMLLDLVLKALVEHFYVSVSFVSKATGASIRQINYWAESGHVNFSLKGNARRFDFDALLIVWRIYRLIDDGFALESAAFKAKEWFEGNLIQNNPDKDLNKIVVTTKQGFIIERELALQLILLLNEHLILQAGYAFPIAEITQRQISYWADTHRIECIEVDCDDDPSDDEVGNTRCYRFIEVMRAIAIAFYVRQKRSLGNAALTVKATVNGCIEVWENEYKELTKPEVVIQLPIPKTNRPIALRIIEIFAAQKDPTRTKLTRERITSEFEKMEHERVDDTLRAMSREGVILAATFADLTVFRLLPKYEQLTRQ